MEQDPRSVFVGEPSVTGMYKAEGKLTPAEARPPQAHKLTDSGATLVEPAVALLQVPGRLHSQQGDCFRNEGVGRVKSPTAIRLRSAARPLA